MQQISLLERLRGKPLCAVGEHGTMYRQGSFLCVSLVVLLVVVIPWLRDFLGVGITFLLLMVGMMFGSVLSVRFELPNGRGF